MPQPMHECSLDGFEVRALVTTKRCYAPSPAFLVRVLRTPFHVLSAQTTRSVTARTSMPARGTSYEVSGTSVYDNIVLSTPRFVRNARRWLSRDATRNN